MIFLEPEASFAVDVTKPGKHYKVVDGGPYVLRTATGREFGNISSAFRAADTDALYTHLERHLVKGIDPASIGRVHPDVVALLLAEVLTRSRMSEADRGN